MQLQHVEPGALCPLGGLAEIGSPPVHVGRVIARGTALSG